MQRQRYNCFVLPPFERSGNLPPGVHSCNWDEFTVRFGSDVPSERRARLMRGLAAMLWALQEASCRVAYVDGSFVTRQRWPQDFDVCYEAEGMVDPRLDPIFFELGAARAAQKSRFGGEAMPTGFPFDWRGRTVLEAFQRDKETGEAKGIVRLDLLRMAPEHLAATAGGNMVGETTAGENNGQDSQ